MNDMATTTAVRASSAGEGSRSPQEDLPELVIRPRRGWISVNWAEMFHYRELLYFLVWRDVKVRYKQTVLGVAWAVIQPLFNMIVFTVIFGGLAKIDSEGLPYAVFVYAGLLPWTFFATSLTQGGQSLVNQGHLLTKIYFPRIFVPAAVIGGALLDLAISFGIYGLILAWYGCAPSWQIIYLPLLVLWTAVATLGITVGMAAFTLIFRDFRFVLPFLVQTWLYLSPVVYPVSVVPERYRWLLALNPMTGIIQSYRSAILGRPWDLQSMLVSIAVSVGLLFFGLFYFRRTERRFADIA